MFVVLSGLSVREQKTILRSDSYSEVASLLDEHISKNFPGKEVRRPIMNVVQVYAPVYGRYRVKANMLANFVIKEVPDETPLQDDAGSVRQRM